MSIRLGSCAERAGDGAFRPTVERSDPPRSGGGLLGREMAGWDDGGDMRRVPTVDGCCPINRTREHGRVRNFLQAADLCLGAGLSSGISVNAADGRRPLSPHALPTTTPQTPANRGSPRSTEATCWLRFSSSSCLLAAKNRLCPRQDSNLRTRLRRPMLYPLSYEGGTGQASGGPASASDGCAGSTESASGRGRSGRDARQGMARIPPRSRIGEDPAQIARVVRR